MKNGLNIDKHGNKRYYLNNKFHRVDGPAQELVNGSKFWYLNGELHRVDGPAVERAYGAKVWYLNGERHRVDGPAEEWASGSKFWYLHGKYHCADGPAVIWADGTTSWWINDKRLIHPDEFENMEEWFEKLNTDEEYSLPWINDINGIIEYITNPTDKQKRLNAMKWKL